MKLFKLEFEGRLKGAIGIFYKITQEVKAMNEESAKNILRLKYEINGFYSCKDISEYQGWTNSKTWNAAFLIDQDIKSNKYLEACAIQGIVTAQEVEIAFKMRLDKIPLEQGVFGVINWQEIANEWNDKDFSMLKTLKG